MLRDDIRDKIIELIHKEFPWIKGIQSSDNSRLSGLNIESSDLRDFAEALLEEFILEEIELSKLMEWKTVKDIVDYIEVALENKIGDEQ